MAAEGFAWSVLSGQILSGQIMPWPKRTECNRGARGQSILLEPTEAGEVTSVPSPAVRQVRLSRGSPVAVKRQLQVEAAPRWSPAFMGAFQLTWLLCIPGDTNATKPVTHSDCRKGWIQNPADPELSAHGAV